MKPMGCVIGAILAIIAVVAVLFGFIFVVGSMDAQGNVEKPVYTVSGTCLLFVAFIFVVIAAIVLIKAYRDANKEPKESTVPGSQTTIVQQIDLPGELSLEKMKCQSCGATLSKDSITTRAGAVVIDCPYCGTSYEVEEEPKW